MNRNPAESIFSFRGDRQQKWEFLRGIALAFAGSSVIAASIYGMFQYKTRAGMSDKEKTIAMAEATRSDEARRAKIARTHFDTASSILDQNDPSKVSEAAAHLTHALRTSPDFWPALHLLQDLLVNHRWHLRAAAPKKISAESFPDFLGGDLEAGLKTSERSFRVESILSPGKHSKEMETDFPIRSIRMSHDGVFSCAEGTSNEIAIFENTTGSRKAEHSAWTQSPRDRARVVFSDTSRFVIFPTKGNEIQLVGLAEGVPSFKIRFPGIIKGLSIPSGSAVVLIGWDAEDKKSSHVGAWSVDTREMIGQAIPCGPLDAAFPSGTARGEFLLGRSEEGLRMFNTDTGKPAMEAIPGTRNTSFGTNLAPGSTRGIINGSLWNLHKPSEPLVTFRGGVLQSDFHSSLNLVAITNFKPEVLLSDDRSGIPHGLPLHHGTNADWVTFPMNPELVVTHTTDERLHVWKFNHRTSPSSMLLDDVEPAGKAISNDGNMIVWSGNDGSVAMSELRTGEDIFFSENLSLSHFQFSSDNSRLLSYDWELKSWVVREIPSMKAAGPPVKIPSWPLFQKLSKDGRTLILQSDQTSVQVWNVDTGTRIGEDITTSPTLVTGAASIDGNHVFGAGKDHAILIHDITTMRPIGPPVEPESPVMSVDISSDKKDVAVLSMGKSYRIHLFEPTTGALKFPPIPCDMLTTSVRISPDGSQVAAITMSGTARVWSTGDGELLGELASAAKVSSKKTFGLLEIPDIDPDLGFPTLAWSADSKRLAITHVDKTVRIWSPRNSAVIHRGKSTAAMDVRFSPSGNRVISGSSVWPLFTRYDACPPEFCDFVEAVIQRKVDAQGVLSPVESVPAEIYDSAASSSKKSEFWNLAGWMLDREKNKEGDSKYNFFDQ